MGIFSDALFHLLQIRSSKMVNWHDPSLLLNDYAALIKLNHALAGIFIWEILISLGFELDILRGKQPYRWTIWLYLGTRYTGLLTFIIFFIDTDGARVPCQPFMVVNFALPYASWAFASSIIVLRVIAIWNRNIIVSVIAVGMWVGGVALNIRNLTMVKSVYNPLVNACIVERTHEGLVNSIGVFVADIVLLLTMLIGLLRHEHRNPTGIWRLLYQQCIIWISLAAIAEIPAVVFLILNLNDVWNEMFTGPAITILSIGAARMYRSLSKYGPLTESVYVMSSDLPRFSGVSTPSARYRTNNTFGPISFATVTQMTRSENEAPVFLPADQVLQVDFVPGISDSSLGHENRVREGAFKKVSLSV